MSDFSLSEAVEYLGRLTHHFSDADLEQPWAWGPHDEGVRFAFLGTFQELQQLAAHLRHMRRQEGRPVTQAQEILGQYLTAYRELEALLLGVSDEDYSRRPAPAEWPLRYVLAHTVGAQRQFFALAHYGVNRQRSAEERPVELPAGEADRLLGSSEGFGTLVEEGSLAEMLALYHDLNRRTVEDLADISDEELDAPTLWWEGIEFPVRHRLHRFTAHAVQHTIQAEKTLEGIGRSPGEVKRLLRLVYRALAEVETALLGAAETGRAEQEALAQTIHERAETVQAVVEQAHELLAALRENDLEQMQKLMKRNPAIVNARGENGLSAVLNAVYQGRPEAADALIAAGTELTIHEAAATGRLDIVKETLKDWAGWKDYHGRDGFTPLQLACYFGREEVALFLIECEADVNAVAQNSQQIRPVHAAAANGNLVILRALLANGADPNLAQEGGYTPLHQAAHRGDEAMVRLLLEHGADRAVQTTDGRTPYDVALADGHPAVATLLQE